HRLGRLPERLHLGDGVIVTRDGAEQLLDKASVHPQFVAGEPCGRRHAALDAGAKEAQLRPAAVWRASDHPIARRTGRRAGSRAHILWIGLAGSPATWISRSRVHSARGLNTFPRPAIGSWRKARTRRE